MTPDPVVGQEIGEALRGVLPPWVIPVFVAITRLGNPGFFLAVFALDYWFGDHRRGAHALGLAIGGMALVTALKTFFDAPRPPTSVNVIPISGYSFPSGHATGAAIGYGILAHDLEIGSRRARFGVAAVMVSLIALSRVVLGVHYVRDVVVGVLVGVAFVAAGVYLTEHDPESGFTIGVVLGVAALVVSGASHDGVAIFGAGVGGALAWSRLDAIPRIGPSGNALALLGVATPVLGVLAYVGAEMHVHPAAAFVLNAVVMAGVLATPSVVTRLWADAETASIS
jgi:membrane-associated phospholipid phosphatase